MHNQVTIASRLGGQGEVDAERCRNIGPICIDVDESDMGPREPSQQACHAAAQHAGADNRRPVAEQRCGVPQRVDSGFDGSG